MLNFFSTGRRSFLTGGWLKTWGQTWLKPEGGPFGVFKGTILNSERAAATQSPLPKDATVLYYIVL